MPKTYENENPLRLQLRDELQEAARKNDSALWKTVAGELSRSRKNRREVNLGKLNQRTAEGDVVVVPGKLLADGVIDHKLTVAALKFTDAAKKKIESSGGKALTIHELIKKNPSGSGITIIG